MDPRLLRYYERELKHVRELGGEFAREYPKIAGRLGLDAFECADPYVERLLEAFAFLTAGVQLKLDAEFPGFIQHMLEFLYPGYLAPTPSMAVVQLKPDPREGSLAEGFVVPRGTALRGSPGNSSSACEYKTAHDLTLWPIELVSAEYSCVVGDFVDLERASMRSAKSALRVVLRATSGLSFEKIRIDRLPLFIRGSNEVAMRLHELLLSANVGFVAKHGERRARQHVVAGGCVHPVGFDDDQALLPSGARAFEGQRLLHEYFAFPARFMFAEVRGLGPCVREVQGNELELVLLFSRADTLLEGTVKSAQLALFCTPAVNLFKRSSDRIHLTGQEHEHLVVPDRTRPLDLEVHSVAQVLGYGGRGAAEREFLPLYAVQGRAGHGDDAAYYTLQRRPRMLSARERSHGSRTTYVGSEVYVTLVDGQNGGYDPKLKQLAVSTLCTNRDLPLYIVPGQGATDFHAQTGAPVESIRCVAGPTPPRPSPAQGQLAWRLLSHLSLDYLSLVQEDVQKGAASVRELLSLYADLSDPGLVKQLHGLTAVSARGVVRPLPVSGPLTFGRGIEVTLECDEAAFEGGSAFLLSAVLERFFAKYASINAFTETVLRTPQRGEIMRWPTTAGRRKTV